MEVDHLARSGQSHPISRLADDDPAMVRLNTIGPGRKKSGGERS
jgi:hypothetical protein